MGFFSDLKEDLSQAVNELMPEEELNAALAGVAEEAGKEEVDNTGQAPDSIKEEKTDPLQGMLSEEPATAQTASESSSLLDSVDLSSMLDKLEETEEEKVEDSLPEEEFISSEPETLTTSEMLKEQEEPVMEPIIESEAAAAADMTPGVLEQADNPVEETETQTDAMVEDIAMQISKGDEKKMDVQTRTVSDETAVVTAGMSITGDVVSEGSLELIGTVNGNIDVLGKLNITGAIQGNSKAAEIFAEGAKITGEIMSQGSVKIGQSSVVIGNITATSAVIAGAVKGDIDVQGPVILDTSAIVMGNIKSKSVQINNGAVIEGMCSQCYADVNPTSFFEDFKKKK